MAANFLQKSRHGSVFYFRRRIPDDLRGLTGQTQVFRTLHTTDRREAVVRARALATESDRFFTELRHMAKKQKLFRTDFKLKFHLDESGKPSAIEVDAEAHESAAVNSALATVIAGVSNAALKPAGQNSANRIVGRASESCLADAITAYDASSHLKPASARRYASVLDKVKAFFGAETELKAITQERFAKYAAMINADTKMADKTKNIYITVAGTFFTWCRSRHDDLPILQTRTLKPRRTTPESEDRAAFSLEDLRVLLDAVKPLRDVQPHHFWITALSAFTGARLEELAQLDIRKEIGQTDDGRYWYIDITEAGGGSVKTKASVRKVPLHPALIEAGFLVYLGELKAAGATRPFPQWKPRVDPRYAGKKYSHKASRWGSAQLARLEREGKISRPKAAYFHSMRHGLINHMKQRMVDEKISCAIVGHETGGIDQNRYGKQYDVSLLGDRMVEAMAGYADLLC